MLMVTPEYLAISRTADTLLAWMDPLDSIRSRRWISLTPLGSHTPSWYDHRRWLLSTRMGGEPSTCTASNAWLSERVQAAIVWSRVVT